MSDVKHYWPEEIVGTGELVVYLTDYAALEAELARLSAGQEPDGCMIAPIQPTEEMRKRAQDYLAAEGMIVSDWLVHTVYTEMLAAAPSAPATVQGVNAQMLEALTDSLELMETLCAVEGDTIRKARAAIAAAQEGGK